MTKLIISLAAIAAFTAPAFAEPATVETRTVALADLDLATPAGLAQLDRRFVRAAIDVCGTASEADLAGKNQVRACRTRTLAAARQLGQQRVAAASHEEIKLAAR